VTLEPGSYIVLPRTTGCTLKRQDDYVKKDKEAKRKLLVEVDPEDNSTNKIIVTENQDCKCVMSLLFESTLCDIFSKFDLQNTNQFGLE
jgi:hypothetical protein